MAETTEKTEKKVHKGHSITPPREQQKCTVDGCKVAHYRANLAEADKEARTNPGFGQVDVARWVYVAETDAKAKQDSEEGLLRHLKPVVHMSETPPFWARPAVPLGYHRPAWP